MLRDRTLGYLFLFPAILVILSLVAYPFASAVVMTFLAKTAGAPGRFIGLENYRELLLSEQFLRAVVNTVVYTAVGVGLSSSSGSAWRWCSTRSACSITSFAPSSSFPGPSRP